MHKMEKKWINGYENMYAVSRCGKIFSYHSGKEKELKPAIKKGYKTVDLYGKEHKTRTIHRLVAKAFIPNPENLPQINHEDGDKLNNNDWNLSWTTPKGNTQHALRTGLSKPAAGEAHYKAKFSKITAIEILDLIKNSNLTQKEIGKIYSVSPSVISALKTGRSQWGRNIDGFEPSTIETKGETHYNAKLAEIDVMKIKQLLKQNTHKEEIAKNFNVSRGCIEHIDRGTTWRHITL